MVPRLVLILPPFVVSLPSGQLRHNGPCVRRRVHADIVALEYADEGLGHAVRLRAAYRGSARDKSDGERDATDV